MPERMSKYSTAKKSSRPKPRVKGDYSGYRTKTVKSKAEIRATVRSELVKAAEKKRFIFYGANETIGTAVNTVPSGQYLLPQISQGTDDAKRIGNKIRLVKGTLSVVVNLRPYDVVINPNPGPIWLKVWICSNRPNTQANALSITGIASDFLNVSNANIGLQGSCLDLTLPVNEDNWIVHETRVVKLGNTNALATGPTSTASYLDNSDMAKQLMFDLTPYAKGLIQYNDASTVPVNKNLFIAFQAVRADGTSSFGALTSEYHYALEWQYIDV